MSRKHERLEELLFASTCEPFPEAERAELNALLRDKAEARNFTARFLITDALLAESLAANENSTTYQPIPISTGRSISRPNWLARAAAWIGAFHLFSNTAKATTTTILMKKTVTSITAALIILGGSGIYAIHSHNESSRTRLETMETEIHSLSDQIGIKTVSSANRRAGTTNAAKNVSVAQVLALYDGDNRFTMQEGEILKQFEKQLAVMDVESLKNLLLDLEKISSPINDKVAKRIIDALIMKSPADATQIASQLIGRNSDFLFQLSHSAANAFNAWLSKDSAAADAWYVATATAGGLNSKSIPPNGLGDLAIDRSFARSRLAEQIKTNPTEAAAMIASMLPGDVTSVIQGITDPATLLKFLPKLDPAQRGPAAEGAIKAMATTDMEAAFTWAKSLEMSDRDRSSLLATGIEAAVGNGKLDLAGVSEWSKDLSLDAKRRSDMLASAASSVSLIPRKNPNVIDVENSVYWDRVPGNIDWLRKEAPAGSAGEVVGDYLGKLSYNSHNLDQSIKAYESEVARQGNIDSDLTYAFARWLSMNNNDQFSAAALKLLHQLPPSEKREDRIQMIEMNR